nr:MAG TPA: hypothetical protein [Caudoviricetes sp.]
MVRQQIAFLMLIVAAMAGVIALSMIADIAKQWNTMRKKAKIGVCLMVGSSGQ